MRRTWIVISLAAAALAACGGSTQTNTVTVTKTVTAPAQSQASAPPPASSAPATTPTTTTAPEGETTASTPLPAGIVGADGTYVGETSGKTGCANEESSPTRQRYSVRLTAPMEVGARSEARTMDVYFTEVARGCSLSRVARGVVSWRGIRKS